MPWAFGSDVGGAAVPDNAEWNNTVLAQDGRYVGFVDAHYYPFSFGGSTGGGNPSDQQVLQALRRCPRCTARSGASSTPTTRAPRWWWARRALLSTSTSSARTVTFRSGLPRSGQLRTWTYSAGNQNAADSNIVQGTVSASAITHGVTLPPESMVILRSS